MKAKHASVSGTTVSTRRILEANEAVEELPAPLPAMGEEKNRKEEEEDNLRDEE